VGDRSGQEDGEWPPNIPQFRKNHAKKWGSEIGLEESKGGARHFTGWGGGGEVEDTAGGSLCRKHEKLGARVVKGWVGALVVFVKKFIITNE